jgi:hypothetical protein
MNGVCILALDISKQIALFLLCIILLMVASQTLPYFSTLPQKGMIFGGKKITEHEMCVLIILTTFV